MTRREFFAAQAAALVPLSAATGLKQLRVSVFSKHFHWLGIPAMADAAKEIGFDAIDLTVRKGGHIEPEKALTELPKAIEAIRSRGLEVEMITTGITSVESPHAEDILRACAESKIRYFRWGGWTYDRKVAVDAQIAQLRGAATKLAKLSGQHQTCGIYHTHSGIDQFGAAIWDIHAVLKDIDPKALAINYDIGHATIEGGFGGWIDSTRLCGLLMRGVAVKDFLWEKNAKGQWRPEWKPLGEGMVDFSGFFKLIAAQSFQGPLQLHFEYPMGGADHGNRTITWSRDQVLTAMRRDLQALRGFLGA